MRDIATAEDADGIRAEIESIYDGWFTDVDRIDWEDFLDRLENAGDWDLGADLNSPAIRRIKAIVRELRKQAQ